MTDCVPLSSVSVVASVYNEEKNVEAFYAQVAEVMGAFPDTALELIFVDDGSTDGSYGAICALREKDGRVRAVKLSRNFGHEAAMLAGVDRAGGDAVICMDSDLQHPPEMIPEMLRKYREGFDVVNMTRSRYHQKTPLTKRLFSFLFYKFLNIVTSVKLEENASDFFLVSRRAADILRSEYREQTRFLRGFIQIMGFRKTALDYVSRERHSGESKYDFKKLLRLSVNALTSFSNVPLRIGVFAGSVTGLFSIIVAVYSLIKRMIEDTPPGYTTLVVLISVMFSINFFVLGIIGEYIGHILYEVKKRPLYIVDEEKSSG
ncbi:MAG: glycosyltransferase family 2 protein [Clostridiales bacterium]|nr:glycosyltransferase family 2 protein [Clostridiales bacterium]